MDHNGLLSVMEALRSACTRRTRFEVVPRLTRLETIRLDCISSLNFPEFTITNVINHPERHILFKGYRILEHRLEMLQNKEDTEEKTNELFLVYLKLGHITLLAQDYAKALFTYQRALLLRPNLFWRDAGGYFGLGIVYLHFQCYRSCIEAFSRLLYCYPCTSFGVEVHSRIAVAYQAVKEFQLALKHYNEALSDSKESNFLTKTYLRCNIALCHDAAGNLDKAYEEFRALLQSESSHSSLQNPSSVQLQAYIVRQLGWLCFRAEVKTEEERARKLQEAESYLLQSKALDPNCGKTYYYLGRCYGESPPRAHEAFVHYRCSIDKSEADADTWCSIGVLYHQQQQPMDALQAFICAVDLDSEHAEAWTNLGNLYESTSQFADALTCYKTALKFDPNTPELIKARIVVLERELQAAPSLTGSTPAASGAAPVQMPPHRLPPLKDAWSQPIPSELRGRQEDFLKQKQQKYRDGSPLWKMGELANVTTCHSYEENRPLDPVQQNMMRLLKANEDCLDESERAVLAQLQLRYSTMGALEGDLPLCAHSVSGLPSEQDASKFTSLFDLPEEEAGTFRKKCKREEPEEEAEGSAEEKAVPSSSTTIHTTTTELPSTFSLLAPLSSHVSLDITAGELLDMCQKRVEKPNEFVEMFDERMPPPTPPEVPSSVTETQCRPAPIIVVESKKDCISIDLQKFCETQPLALIRGLTAQLKMDLSLFSTKTLLDVSPDHEVEVRTQHRMPNDMNVDHLGQPTWEYKSFRTYTTIAKYAQYQAETFRASLKEEEKKLRTLGAKYVAGCGSSDAGLAKKKKGEKGEATDISCKQLKFGTNIDLSDEKFKAQLTELAKMPPFCRLIAGCNLLSHIGHTILGMNTVQLYLKVPGARTPGHQENNNLASVNINIGPGECEWYGVPYEYWGKVEEMCKARGIDFLKGSYWPSYEDLLQEGVPVYKSIQKAGDLMWVGPGCVHWVQSTGWCNNVAWNVGPISPGQLKIAINSYEWNRLRGYKSLVPMQHVFWQLAKNVKPTNQKLFNLVRTQLIRSLAYCKMVADFAESRGKAIKSHPRTKGEITHYCTLCEIEVFNILFVKECNGKFTVSCVDCARRAHLQIPKVQLTA